MATITLTEGDFGSETTARISEDDLFLPDRARPGMTEMVPLTMVAEIESVGDDRSGQFKEAGKLAMRGASILGPFGLAAGVFAVRKVKDVKFAVRLKDGRGFVATTDAATYATIRASFVGSKSSGLVEDARAEQVIAKYLNERKAAVVAAVATPPDPVPAAAPAKAAPSIERPPAAVTGARPVFGRRGR